MLLYIVVIVVDVLYAVRTPRQTSLLADGTLLLKLNLSIYLSIYLVHMYHTKATQRLERPSRILLNHHG